MIELHGSKPGPACPAYHRHKNREHCQKTNCRPLDYDENLDAHSVKHPKVFFGGKEFFEEHEECVWHCVKYDEPSKYVDLPWELE